MLPFRILILCLECFLSVVSFQHSFVEDWTEEYNKKSTFGTVATSNISYIHYKYLVSHSLFGWSNSPCDFLHKDEDGSACKRYGQHLSWCCATSINQALQLQLLCNKRIDSLYFINNELSCNSLITLLCIAKEALFEHVALNNF